MPKYAPWGSPASSRETATSSKVGAIAVSAEHRAIAAASTTSTRWRGYLAAKPEIVGAPMTTPSA